MLVLRRKKKQKISVMMCSRYFQRYLQASKRHTPLSQCKYMQTIYDVKYPHGVWTACELKDTGVGATEVSGKLFFVQQEGYCWVHAEIIRSEELFVTLIIFSTGTTASCDKRGKSVISDNHLHLNVKGECCMCLGAFGQFSTLLFLFFGSSKLLLCCWIFYCRTLVKPETTQ